jgi:hypothetical protein
MTSERDLRLIEFKRLRRRSYWITGCALAIAAASWTIGDNRMIELTRSLMRGFKLDFDAAAFLVIPVFVLIPLAGIVLVILAAKNGAAVVRLGCVECGSRMPFFTLNFRRNCSKCGAPRLRTL